MTDKYDIEYMGVTCIGADWENGVFKFIKDGKEYNFVQTRGIICRADTDHIRCVIEDQFLPFWKDQHIKELEAENAELRARLDKAVELPCEIGDKVYAIVPIEDELKILDGTFVGIEEVVSDFKGCMCAIIVRQAKDGNYFNTYWDLSQFNRTWWADKEIVESKLAEVMGNNEM